MESPSKYFFLKTIYAFHNKKDFCKLLVSLKYRFYTSFHSSLLLFLGAACSVVDHMSTSYARVVCIRLGTITVYILVGIGVATFPSALNWLQMNVEYLYCLLIMSGVLSIISLMGLLMTPPPPMANSKLTIEIFKVSF